MTTISDRSSNSDTLQGLLFDQIAKLFAKENDLPMMAAGGNAVLEQVEWAVESFLLRETRPVMGLSPEINAMAEMWRKLERESRSRRVTTAWSALPAASFSAPMAI